MRCMTIGLMLVCGVCCGQETGEIPGQSTLALGPVGANETDFVWRGVDTLPRTELKTEAQRVHELRVKKAERLVATFYPGSGFLPYCDYLVTTHERMEADHGAPGFGAAYYWSLVYGAANFSLRVGGVAPGNCAGPMDVKAYPLVRDPVKNIDWHCREMLGFYKRGVRGRRLCEYVMLPARPHDWGGGRFRRTDMKFRECIAQGYAVGKLID